VPWELGLSDGAKTNGDIAIFPLAEMAYNTSWMNQEYLGLYRKIVWGKHADYTKEIWMVWNEVNNTATELSEWISK
jgi:hypothetical protein